VQITYYEKTTQYKYTFIPSRKVAILGYGAFVAVEGAFGLE